ncbi:hypothetical protein ACS15_1020 [Ralstonia insidiosa]|uniref:Uncharacterized protein n=1 Tax=Ralstonia insidiosa TaxID=190721 RepID=A0AAC9BCM5_9RALS|nr:MULTISPECIES: hypothetical protein [Ralstonia]ANH71428.1 hypothetical protein ACS15_1020 [Ralstonia insidiosa]EPX97483.1 hypothetical protein C404_13270 [Ralstonia sp. AU12-08]MBY4703604.1 hypothetical protein [Ralstonia insidiosa]GAQ31412.1 hypothetical protein SAMD00023378_5095 [Ralstonia sp. NT80]
MDSLNFTIDGDLGLPGFVRVPPPFGTRRDAVRAIHATLARVESDARQAAAATAHQVSRARRHRRLTVLAIGVACTVAAALIGSHTGKRQQPIPHIDPTQYAAIAQAPVPSAPQNALVADTAPDIAANAATDSVEVAPVKTEAVPSAEAPPDINIAAKPKAEAAPVLSKLADPATKPRTLARATGRAAAPAAPARSVAKTDDAPEVIERYHALDDTAPVTSGYVAPGTSVRIELQRHTRLTD